VVQDTRLLPRPVEHIYGACGCCARSVARRCSCGSWRRREFPRLTFEETERGRRFGASAAALPPGAVEDHLSLAV